MYSQIPFNAITRMTGDGLCLAEIITDPDGNPVDYRFLRINDLFAEFTGLKNATGRTALEMVPELERSWIDYYARVGLGRETLRFENHSPVMKRWFEVQASPAEKHGQLYIMFRDITARKLADEAREHALEQSQQLFQELGHRVKNSLAVISSITKMEARSAGPEAKEALDRVRARISAVAQLYAAMHTDQTIDAIQMDDYLTSIIHALRNSVEDHGRLSITTEVEPILLNSHQAVNVGLVVNELVTNCVKHAFAPDQNGEITVALSAAEGTARLDVHDNGNGGASREGSGLGHRLITAFIGDLGGTRDSRTRPEGGSTVSVTFPIKRD
ncbi:ATP-binding protein [Sagittula sp. NFXS13]|uniref:sensor histidine kinase n=1 Tax=Sagittula sp. NFXS13 TaxID=2819095 RepID=UPI0032DEC1BD